MMFVASDIAAQRCTSLLRSVPALTMSLLCFVYSLHTHAEPARDTSGAVPPLDVVLQRARTHAPQVRLGAAALAVSRTEYVNARRPPVANPNFEFVGQHGSQSATRGVAWGGTMWLPFELWGQRTQRVNEAEAYQTLFEAELDVAEASALGEAYAAFGESRAAAERLHIVEQMATLARRTSEIYENRLASGDAVLRDTTMARVEVARNEVVLQTAHAGLVDALVRLGRATGERYTHVVDGPATPPPVDLDEYLARLQRRLPPVVSSAESEAQYFESQKARLDSETLGPLSLMLLGGRGDLGEARVGVGLAYEVPLLRSLQGEKARASSEALRARTRKAVAGSVIERRVAAIAQQYQYAQNAYELLTSVAVPAAAKAVESATLTLEAGKSDWFAVLLSRRDLMALSLERLDVVSRQWSLVGELITLTGELP